MAGEGECGESHGKEQRTRGHCRRGELLVMVGENGRQEEEEEEEEEMMVVSEAMLCHRPQAHMSLSLLCFAVSVPCFQWTRHFRDMGTLWDLIVGAFVEISVDECSYDIRPTSSAKIPVCAGLSEVTLRWIQDNSEMILRRRPEDPPDGAPPHLSFPRALAVRVARRAPRGAVPVDAAWSFLQQFARKCRGFYSNGYGAPVPEVLTAPIAYHAIVLRRSFRGPCGEVRGVPTATGEGLSCTPYLCQFDRMMADPPMLASGRA
ncbi:hypothetical protein GW17_00021769 [Ensete ventricosum]|nr:hypothetical protein GW17_00021769 [Ensete ventricosum]